MLLDELGADTMLVQQVPQCFLSLDVGIEEVTLELVKRKCMHILLYGLECYTLLKADIRSLNFVVTRFLMKLFKSTNTDTINDCRTYFNFLMPGELVEIRKNRFEGKFIECSNLLYCIILVLIR